MDGSLPPIGNEGEGGRPQRPQPPMPHESLLGPPRLTYDQGKIRDLYQRMRSRMFQDRQVYERDWFRNVLYYLGVQWIVYTPVSQRWQPRPLKKWVPRPVTNKFAGHANAMIQIFSSKTPIAVARPSTNSPDDVSTADLVNQAIPVLYDEAGAEEAQRVEAAWKVLCGNAVLHACYDPDPQYGMAQINDMMCPNCQTIVPEDQAPETGECPGCGAQMVPQTDEMGASIGQKVPKGRLKIEVFSPFECYVDLEARSEREIQEILIRRRYSIEVVRSRWPQPPGEEVQPDPAGGEGSTGLNLLRGIAYAAGMQWGGYAGASREDEQSVTVDFVWKRPCEDYPQGLAAVFCNDKLLNKDALEIPYKNDDGSPRWTFHHSGFDKVPGRFWYRTPLDDVAPKQEQRNKLESLIQLIVARCANPVWLRPKNTGIVEFTGEPGQDIEYNFVPGGPKPERIPGENVPTSLIAWLEKIDTDMEELAGTYEVLKGNAPTGVSAGTALRLLLERAVNRFTPALMHFEHVWGEVTSDLIAIFKQYGTEERIAQIQGPGKTWERKAFKGADLTGGVDIRVEVGSAVPKNSVGTQALIQDLAAMQVIVPAEPETQYKILEEFGMTKLLGTVDENIKHAQREQYDFSVFDIPMQVNPIVDNHMVHKVEHLKVALSSDFKLWPPDKQGALVQHIMEHDMYAMSGAPQGTLVPGMPPPGGGPPDAPGPPNAPGMPPMPATTEEGVPSHPEGMSEVARQDSGYPPAFPGGM
jgi:hypothetical protein